MTIIELSARLGTVGRWNGFGCVNSLFSSVHTLASQVKFFYDFGHPTCRYSLLVFFIYTCTLDMPTSHIRLIDWSSICWFLTGLQTCFEMCKILYIS